MGKNTQNRGVEEYCPVCGNVTAECVCCPECGHNCPLEKGELYCPVCSPTPVKTQPENKG